MKKILLSIALLAPSKLMSFEKLKKVVPSGISASKSQSRLQQLKQAIQRKASPQEIRGILKEYKRSLEPIKPFWKESSVPALPHVATVKERAVANFETALKRDASYERLEQLLQTIERSK